MRKTLLGALIASAFAVAGPAQAGLMLDLNGSAAGGVINADALDWAPTSFLALGGNTAIQNFLSGQGDTTFDVLTHAKLTAYAPVGSNSFTGLPSFAGEITMVARYTEQVVGFSSGTFPTATFASTGTGWLEFYYSPTADSNNLTGGNFNNGTLIGRLEGVTSLAVGTFTVTGGAMLLDGTSDGDQYAGQQTVKGTGSQDNLQAGLTSIDLDPTFFLNGLNGFTFHYANISIGLPYISANPSDCFNGSQSGASVGTTGLASTCDNAHDSAQYSGQVNGSGYTPNVGAVNGLNLGNPDFVAQTDFNSPVTGVPEPGTLALVGLALGGLGFAARRRRG